MPNQPVSLIVDEARRLLTLRVTGRGPSAEYTDLMLDAYRGVAEPWRYNRLIDHRQFRGFIEHQDLIRVNAYWAEVMEGRSEMPRVALLTRSALAHARVSASGNMFSNAHFRAFSSTHDAMEWLLAEPVA